MTAKRPWRDGELSPWAGDEHKPTILEAARMYPGRAISHAFFVVFPALIVTAFLYWGIFKTLHALLSVAYPNTRAVMAVAIPIWVVTFVGLWCEAMYQDVHGLAIFTSGD